MVSWNTTSYNITKLKNIFNYSKNSVCTGEVLTRKFTDGETSYFDSSYVLNIYLL